MSMVDLMIETQRLRAVVATALGAQPANMEALFFASMSVSVEQALLMQQANPDVFKEHGGIRKWIHDMADVALTETEHAMILRGQRKN